MEESDFFVLNNLLNDTSKTYTEKVEGLLTGWKNIHSILFNKPTKPYNEAMNYMHRSTLQYLLHGDWTQLEASLRAKFTVILHKVLMAISKTDPEALRRCKLLIKLVHEPWKNTTLHKILHSLSPTDNEVQEYIATEGSELLLMRLEVLCEGKCEDLALRLAATLLKHLCQNNDFKKTDIDNISDIVLILLFKFKRNQEIIEKLKNLDLMEGLDLVKRFARKHSSSTGLWRFCDKVTEIAAHTVLASGMVQNIESEERQGLLYDLVNEWALIHIPKLNQCVSTLSNMVRKIVQKAESPVHVYIFAQVLHKQLGDQVKPLCIELYIRGFTSNINLIERYKSNNDPVRTLKAEILLSNSFLELSELLQDNIIIHRECILTAFSLHPTEDCLKRLENAALLCCTNCKNEEKYIKSDGTHSSWNNCDNISCVHAREKTDEQFIEAVNSLNILNSDLLGLAPHLCDDLSTVLCSPRCQTLSWSLGWSRLKKQCEKYLSDHINHKPRCTELKYLNIDYSQFKKQSSAIKSSELQSLRAFRKKRICKPFISSSSINTEKSVPYSSLSCSQKRVPYSTLSCSQKKVIDKNILNYSMMKINDLLLENYKVCNAVSEDSNDSNIGMCQKMYPLDNEDAVSFLTGSYSSRSRIKHDNNVRDISYFQSNEGSVLSCSNNLYDEDSLHSPKPAEVPPVSFADSTYHEKLVPLIKSVATNDQKVYLTDVSKNIRYNKQIRKKTELVEVVSSSNLLPWTSLQSDKLLAKYIPGMNSLDLIVPSRPEPTVQVVQIPSPNTTILQPVSSNSSSAIQTNSTTISIAKPLTESISTQSAEIVTTHTQTSHSQVVDSIHDSGNNSNLLLTTVVNQGNLSRIHGTEQRHSSHSSSGLSANRSQNKSSELSSGLTGNRSQNKSSELSSGLAANRSQSKSSELSSGLAANRSQNKSSELSSGLSANRSQNKSSELSSVLAANRSQSKSSELSSGLAANRSQNKSSELSSVLAANRSQSKSSELSSGLAANRSQNKSSELSSVLAANRSQSKSSELSSGLAANRSQNKSSELSSVLAANRSQSKSSELSSGLAANRSQSKSSELSSGLASNRSQNKSSELSSGLAANRSQNKSSELSSASETMTISSEPTNTVVSSLPHEGSTQVTAHIQRVGQPHKQKVLFDEANSLKATSAQNSNSHVPGTIQVFEESGKHSQSGSVYRFLLKDGKIVEQYCHSNQNSAFPSPETLSESNLQGTMQQDHVIKLYKKKKDIKKDDNGNSENVHVPSLPQFHQAFRRQVYQSGSIIEGTSITASSPRQFPEESIDNSKQGRVSSPLSKAVQTVLKDAETSTKCSEKINEDSASCASTPSSGPDIKEEVNDLPSPSGVIFTCKVPISLSGNTVLQAKPVTILKTTNSQEHLSRSTQKSDSDSKNKDSVIRSNMNALLAAALQNSPVKNNSSDSSNSNSAHNMKQVKVCSQDVKTEVSPVGGAKIRMPSPTQKSLRRQSSVPTTNVPSRFSRPSAHSSVNTTNQNAPPVVTIPLPSRAVQVLTTNINQNLPKVDNRREQLPQPSEQSSVSSTTLEQLREFESVLEQVTNTSQMKERGNAKRTDTVAPPTTSTNSDFPNPVSKVNSLFQTSLANAISDISSDNRVSLTFISKASTTCTNTIISGTSPKITATTPVVVVQSCSRPLASPALSIASQNSPGSSPSTPPANSQPKMNPKLSKPKAKSIGKTAPTTTLKVSTLPKPQQKPQEDEQTTQRIYAILDKYAEQLRNSPELKNKPAPRRRSNPPSNPSQSSKRKKSQSKSKSFSSIPSCSGMEMSPGSEDLRTAGSEDSSNGVSQVTQTVNSPHSRSEDHSNPGGDISSDVSESAEKDRLQHRILLTDQSAGSGRTVIVQDNVQPVISVEGTKVIAGKQLVVGSSTTVPLTLSLPGSGNVKQVLFPVPTDGRPFVVAKVPKMYRFHQVTMPSGSPLIASASSGTVLLRQMCLNKTNSTLKQVKLPVVSHMASQPAVVLPSGSQSFTLSTGTSLDSESLGIALDNTILLNSSSASASSIGFIQRNISKSNQSSNILAQNRQMSTQETNTNSSGSEIVTTIKCEDTIIKEENLTGDGSRTSDSYEDFKSEDVKFSVDSLNEKLNKGVSLTSCTSTNNNWVQQVFKDASNIEDNTPGKDADSKGCENLERRNIDEAKHNYTERSRIKQQKIVDASSYCIENMNDSKPIINPHLNDHWQFNIKLEKVCNSIKSESLSPCLRETGKDGDSMSTMQQSQSQGLKRKVENTIFQIAFKRDKMKLSKEDFIQQRSASAIERELRLQKSLSEECEDLGVDKPSTSDLFPDAELLLDPDPLSRDSLQGELFTRAESSSSNLSSPNHSPVFNSKCTNSWKKHKRNMLRHKYSFTRGSSPSKKNISEKTDSSRESTPINLNSSSSKNLSFEVKHSDSNFKCLSKESDCGVHESDIAIECNDSDACNFSDVDDHNDTDILDTECESDNDFLQKTREKHTCNSPGNKELETEKCIETSLLRRLTDSTFGKCDYFYLNKEPAEKRTVENSPWFQMIKGIHKESLNSEIDKSNHGSGEDVTEPHNGVLEEYEGHQDTLNAFGSNKILQARKRKKVGLFLGSPSEDSASSIDTILAGSDSCSGFHDNISKRSSLRGRTKKGCPCFNGSPEPSKKKKDISVHDKTEKPCSTKTVFSFNNKKPVSKSTVKFVNRKR